MGKRLLREIKSRIGWFLVISIFVASAASCFVAFKSGYGSATSSFDQVHQKLDSADIVVSTEPVQNLDGEVESASGVTKVSSAILTDCYTIDNEKMVGGQISGIEHGGRVNDYRIIEGNDLETDNEVVVEHHYAEEHDLKVGDKLNIYIRGKKVQFEVSGICFSPSHIFLISNGGVKEDFGFFYCNRDKLNEIINQENIVNRFYLLTEENGKLDKIVSRVEKFFKSKDISAVVKSKDEMLIRKTIREDMSGFNSLANLFGLLLLSVSAFILFVILSRFVDEKKKEIGTLRAMGVSKKRIFLYYLSFSGLAAFIGLILAVPIGHFVLDWMMSFYYGSSLGIPGSLLVTNLNLTYLGPFTGVVAVFWLLGSFFPAYRASSMTPAEAMKPYGSDDGNSRMLAERGTSPLNKLFLRRIFGHWKRSISMLIVIAVILPLVLSFALSMGSLTKGLEKRYDTGETWEIQAGFTSPQNPQTLEDSKKLRGVESVEPYSLSSGKIFFENKNTTITVKTIVENSSMVNLSLSKGSFSPGNIVVSGDVKNRLNLSLGDKVTVSTSRKSIRLKVSGILQSAGMSEGYIVREKFHHFGGALLKVEKGKTNRIAEDLREKTYIDSLTRKKSLEQGWLNLMDMYMSFVYAMGLMAGILVLVTAGMFAFISTREQVWDFTLLKSMGYSDKKIYQISLGSILTLTIGGIMIGIPLSMEVASWFNSAFAELMTLPPIFLLPRTTLLISTMVLIVSIITAFFITRLFVKGNIASRLREVFETM